ncbi:DUF3105 domain-containing protein [Paenibacillus sp. HJGM_3]|uniref:DUF3105 domain-containing protein n=1 Tax=Paenibacillus sp. HJGM_3 TaxID=3379816 RepID=UPI00385803FC
MTLTYVIAGVVVLLASIGGYIYASSVSKQNTSRLKKEQKAQLHQKTKVIQRIGHALLAVSILLFLAALMQNARKYSIENLNYKAAIEVTQDRNYGEGHTDSPVNYEMKFPTSGQHSPHDLKYGFYEEKPQTEKLVHNMEHGDILIYYRTDLPEEQLKIVKRLTKFEKAGSGVLAVPSNDVPAEAGVWVTAWTKTLQLKAFDEKQIGTFIYENINRGPEVIPPETRRGGGTM